MKEQRKKKVDKFLHLLKDFLTKLPNGKDHEVRHSLSQGFESGCPRCDIMKILGVQMPWGNHNIFNF